MYVREKRYWLARRLADRVANQNSKYQAHSWCENLFFLDEPMLRVGVRQQNIFSRSNLLLKNNMWFCLDRSWNIHQSDSWALHRCNNSLHWAHPLNRRKICWYPCSVQTWPPYFCFHGLWCCRLLRIALKIVWKNNHTRDKSVLCTGVSLKFYSKGETFLLNFQRKKIFPKNGTGMLVR